MSKIKEEFTVAETFVGCGGSHLGFKNNGFHTVYLNEYDNNCIDTLKYNNPELFQKAIVDHKDISDIDIKFLTDKLKGKVDVLFGGIVCKGFSLAGEKSPIDERNYLYEKQLELVDAFSPRISIIENVPAMLTAKIVKKNIDKNVKNKIEKIWQELENIKGIKAEKRKKLVSTEKEDKRTEVLRKQKKEILTHLESTNSLVCVFDEITKKYKKLGYNVYYKVLNATWFGSATSRDRLVVVAVRKDIEQIFHFPNSTHSNDEDNLEKIVTVNDILSTINYDIEDDDNKPMKHNAKTIHRFSFIPEGKNIQSVIDKIPQELQISKFYSRGCTMRLDRNKPSPTLVPGHSNFPVHPFEDRSITVREAAMITGFPCDYKFFGSHTSRCEQVGNAVPVHLANAIAKSIKDFLTAYDRR